MELKEAMSIAKKMESHYEAFVKLSDFLKVISELQRLNEGAEKQILALKKEIDGLVTQRSVQEAEIAKRNKEALAEHEAVLAKFKNEAKSMAISLAQAKVRFEDELEGLSSKKDETVDKMNTEVSALSAKKATLESEVDELTNAKATLEAEIQAIKDKFAVLVK